MTPPTPRVTPTRRHAITPTRPALCSGRPSTNSQKSLQIQGEEDFETRSGRSLTPLMVTVRLSEDGSETMQNLLCPSARPGPEAADGVLGGTEGTRQKFWSSVPPAGSGSDLT